MGKIGKKQKRWSVGLGGREGVGLGGSALVFVLFLWLWLPFHKLILRGGEAILQHTNTKVKCQGCPEYLEQDARLADSCLYGRRKII